MKSHIKYVASLQAYLQTKFSMRDCISVLGEISQVKLLYKRT